MGLRNFPGVYARVKDDSFFSPTASRFRCGLIGPAQKGAINVATSVRSLRDFHSRFGKSLPGVYLANAVQLTAEISDAVTVVRVARQYEILDSSGASATGTSGAYAVETPNSPSFIVGDYARVSQIGHDTTVNARVVEVGATSLTLDIALQDDYTAANIDRSRVTALEGTPSQAVNAANEAEAFMYVPAWATDPVGGSSTPVGVSSVTTNTNSQFEVQVDTYADVMFPGGTTSLLAVGDMLKLEQSGLATTREIMVREIVFPVPGVKGKIKFEAVNKSDVGYTALPLQDQYTNAKMYKMSDTPVLGYHLLAANPGTWANSDGFKTGLIVKVVPGTKPDTKKFNVYENSSLVEEIDGLSFVSQVLGDDAITYVDNPDFFVTRINGLSSYIRFALNSVDDVTSAWLGVGDIQPAANTRDGWKISVPKLNVAAFHQGYNGENVIDKDYIGTVDPVTELPTGLKIFEDKDANLQLDIICAPGVTSYNVAMELDRINRSVNTASLFDTPRGYNARTATDWHNGRGLFAANGKLDTYTIALVWNWGTMVDSFTGNRVVVPPSCGALRCLAYTFDAFKPWYAAAGETRGLIPEFLAVEFPRTSEDAKQGMYGAGNCLNPIIVNRQRIMMFGNRTTQRAESKLTAFNNVVLVNTIVKGMSERGRKYIFDPIDDILLAQLYQDFKLLLDGIQNDRGIEEFLLTVDKTNNSASDRNERQVIVDLDVIPIDALEKMFINVTVRESGATLNSVK